MNPPHQSPPAPRRNRLKKLMAHLLLILLLLGAILLGVNWLLSVTLCRSGSWQGPHSDHFDGERFHNPTPFINYGRGSSFNWLLKSYQKGHYPEISQNEHQPELAARVEGADWECTLVNHSTFLIRVGGLNILTDPIWSDEPSPVANLGPSRKRPAGIPWEQLPPIDICLISHDHYDHFDTDTLRRLKLRDNPLFIVPLGLRSLLEYHIGEARVEEKDWWESITPGGLRITLTPAQHWSARYRGEDARNRSLWCGFWIQATGGGPTIYFSGDTAWADIFEQIHQRLGAPDLAIIPIGAYKPDWIRTAHLNPEDAVRAFRTLRARRGIGCHFGTWQMGYESYDETLMDLATALLSAGISPERFIPADNGQTLRGQASDRSFSAQQ